MIAIEIMNSLELDLFNNAMQCLISIEWYWSVCSRKSSLDKELGSLAVVLTEEKLSAVLVTQK